MSTARCMEHYVLHCFRADPAFVPELDLVMELDGTLIGHIMYARSEIACSDGRALPIMTFGRSALPLNTSGKAMESVCWTTLWEKAKEMGTGALAITGNILFYGKSGFVPAKSKGIRYADDPDASYLLIKELTPGLPERNLRHL